MFDIDLNQHGLILRLLVSLGVLVTSILTAAAFGLAAMFFIAVLGDSGEIAVPARFARLLLNLTAGFLAIGALGPCVLVNIRGTLQSGMIPATIGFGGAFACLMMILLVWGADK